MSKKIKNEQKKFLGETLNQYDKALNEGIAQLDKKNREQNHKISSLVNSFDNEFLEKDVEGNITTLENSKDGMVIINEIQGSTEVNYCKDGEKELILNGDIDTQGKSFVTITEGVDGGLVDVSLEGNTEVNLSSTKDPVLVTREFDDINCNSGKLQYTIDDVTTINDEPGKVDIDRIVGDTMVNHAVNGSEELILNAHIDESGDNNITLNGVTSDGGKVDVSLEGNTLVNVSKTKDSTGITKAYTVENSGNHIALQGDIDGTCRPVITGNTLVNLWSNYEKDELVGLTIQGNTISGFRNPDIDNMNTKVYRRVLNLKSNTTYTILANIIKNPIENICLRVNDLDSLWEVNLGSSSGSGLTKLMFTTQSNSLVTISFFLDVNGEFEVTDIFVLEGDYTDKPIPDYFEGLQSSFEDNLVTQEMVDSGEEVADNLGKYKVEYKSIQEDGTVGSTKTLYLNSPLLEGDTIEEKDGGIYHVHRYSEVVLDSSEDWRLFNNTIVEKVDTLDFYIPNYPGVNNSIVISDKFKTNNYGTTYMEDKEAISGCGGSGLNIWLSINKSRLTTQDVAGLKQWLQQNPTTVVYMLAEPTYELIEQQSNLTIDSYANGHLDFDTAVPVEKVEFKPFSEELTYLYANTQYTVQFISTAATTADITLGGTQLLAQNIVKGLNRISITTPKTLVDNKLVISGVGANISEVVVTDTDREFGYFEGMKSVGECEDLEVVISNKNLFDINIFNDINNFKNCQGNISWGYHPILIGIGNKAYLKRKYKDNTTNYPMCLLCNDKHEGMNKTWLPISHGSYRDTNYSGNISADSDGYVYILITLSNISQYKNILDEVIISITDSDYIPHQSNTQQLTHEPLRAVGDVKDRYVLIDGKWYIERKCRKFTFNGSENYWINTGYGGHETRNTFEININTPIHNERRALKSICDKYTIEEIEGIPINDNACRVFNDTTGNLGIYFLFTPSTSIIPYRDIDAWKEWLSVNPITIIVECSPYYEPIDHNPLETYADVTHITTNSAIPCNVIVKNHGYNMVALKENTQYTLYVNKNTTNALTYRLGDYIEINSLSKFTFTTPSTLTDKTLRIDGKGTKVNDLMLIEGIPANDPVGYFDGLKSSYECEKVTDELDENYGKYKVDIKVVGKNKINKPSVMRSVTNVDDKYICSDGDTREFIELKIQSWGQVFESSTVKWTKFITTKAITSIGKYSVTFTKTNIDKYLRFANNGKTKEFNIFWDISHLKNGEYTFSFELLNLTLGALEFKDFQLEEGNTATEYEPYFESTQTIYLNSPLLKGDEIVWKDNKIQHYHKMGRIVLDGSDDEGWGAVEDKGKFIKFGRDALNFKFYPGDSHKLYCDILPTNTEIVETEIERLTLFCHNENYRELRCNLLKSRLSELNVEGLKQWLQANPVTVVYQLETPYYEEISDYPLKLNVIANSSLSTESTIQVTNISFNIYEETLPYLYPNTKYYITFNADVDRNNIIINLGGSHVVFDCKVGFNKVEITTPSDTTNLLTFSGTGVNIDHVKVTQQDIDEYFEGMKSVGECEELEITSANSDNTLSNTQQLIHEPLRAVGDVKDRYTLIDGKWYIERNCIELILDGSVDENYSYHSAENNIFYRIDTVRCKGSLAVPNISDKIYDTRNYSIMTTTEMTMYHNSSALIIHLTNDLNNIDKFRAYLSKNPLRVILALETPIYEPINYNPFEVYTDITHITANSLIPTNVVVKNHGYNCILKPSTKYTIALNKPNGTISAKLGGSVKVDSTNSIFTITTPNTLNDNVLRLSGSGNVKDIMILEGDKTVNTPSYFEGIESVFEQEYDAEKGKYRVTTKVIGKNLFKFGSSIKGGVVTLQNEDGTPILKSGTYTITSNCEMVYENAPAIALYDVKGKAITIVGIKSKTTFSAKEDIITIYLYCNGANYIESKNKDYTFSNIQIEQGDTATSYEPYKESNVTFYIDEPLRGVEDSKDRVFIQDGKLVVQRNCGSITLDGTAYNSPNGKKHYHTWKNSTGNTVNGYVYFNELIEGLEEKIVKYSKIKCNMLPSNRGGHIQKQEGVVNAGTYFGFSIHKSKLGVTDVNDSQQNDLKASEWFKNNPVTVVYQLAEPTYEEADCDLSKLVLENYENSSLIFESNIPVSANIKYSGEVPVVTQAKTLSSKVDNTTLDINENIIPYMCDIDYRIVELQLMNGDTQGEDIELLGIGDIEILGNENVLFNNREDKKHNFSYDMLKRDILSQRYSKEEYQYRLDRYLLANKISDEEYKELEGLLNNGE